MTREEAIVDIRDNIKPVVGGKSLDMAIEALKQLDWIYSDLLRVKHNTMNIDELIDKVYAEKGTEHGKMLVCPNCGLDVHSDFENCPRCGKRIKDILKCKDCRYLSLEKCTIGRMCLNPSKRFRTKTACWKYPTTPACKLFERR